MSVYPQRPVITHPGMDVITPTSTTKRKGSVQKSSRSPGSQHHRRSRPKSFATPPISSLPASYGSLPSSLGDNIPRLGCPLAVYDLRKYASCRGHTFSSSIEVQEHVEASHGQGEYCPICGRTFSASAEARAHIISRSCNLQTPLNIEGVPGDQMNRLSQWGPAAKTTEEERWFEIWSIVFPGIPRPASTHLGI
ncbi:hypothetical protein QBC40DRAFT_283958 [Triangularia verruculosa]|uniref:C2H2-type domain-containing protein n=1 Tax=Triangularia verruculosa TaxID=2587418 RepID=A0AAN6XCV3_9PEZI|nr:hypothetical protein QBC40DRAFT_283958 [Triangularia verruculosa]